MKLLEECQHFRGDLPCPEGKGKRTECNGCNSYTPRGKRCLIIKLGGTGDVVRTTSILPLLKQKYPESTISWLTDEINLPLLENLPGLSEIISYNSHNLPMIMARTFDLIINLEMSLPAAGLMQQLQGKEKSGFTLSPEGYLQPCNEKANYLYSMSLFDQRKKANQLTYQQILQDLLELPEQIQPPLFSLTGQEQESGVRRLEELGINPDKNVVGLNVGSGKRWRAKRWPLTHFMRLNDFLQERNIQTIFLTGPSEPELHNQLTTAGYDNIIGPNLPLREFAGVLSTLTVLVTADTFALHLALAFSTHVISLFGPTSHAEIELFGLGTKLLPDHECQCYYARQCTAEHNCLESIPPLRVMVETLKCID